MAKKQNDLEFINTHREATGRPRFRKLGPKDIKRHLALIMQYAPYGIDPWSPTKARRLTNRPLPKVPYRVWVVSWGYRDSDPAATYAFPEEWTKKDVEKRADMLINQWVREEQETYDDQDITRDVASDTAVYGPFLESYIKTVKDMTTRERKEFETDLNFYGESPLLGRSY